MKRKWLSLIALVMVAVMCTPVIALGGTNIFYVDTANKKSLNMRSDCTMGDNIIASIPYRAEVTVYEFLAGVAWARVEYNGLMGFVMTRYLSGTRPASGGSGGSGGGSSSSTAISYKGFTPAYYTATVKPSNPSGYVNMRWAPSKSTSVHEVYYAGDMLQVIADNGTWCQVYDTSRNICGFMMKQFLTILSVGGEES